MTTTRTFSDSDGSFAAPEETGIRCPKCSYRSVTVKEWESSDGGYSDERFECSHCHHVWWVDGPDA